MERTEAVGPVAGASAIEKMRTETQLYALYAVTCVLICYTLMSVGERGAGMLTVLLYTVVLSTPIINFADFDWGSNLSVKGMLQVMVAISLLVFLILRQLQQCWWQQQHRPSLVAQTPQPVRRSIPRRQFQTSRSSADYSEEVDWCHTPEAVMGEVLKKIAAKDIRSIRLVCWDWFCISSRSLAALSPREFYPSKLVDDFPLLQELDLSNCIERVDSEGISYLQLLKNLGELNMGCNHRLIASTITDRCLAELVHMSKIHTLNFGQCVHISDEGLAILARIGTLTSINISGCVAVTDNGIQNLSQLVELRKLEVPWCLKITDKGLNALSPLSKLQCLNISGCQMITEDGICGLSCFAELEYLGLINTGISLKVCVSDRALQHLSNLSNMKQLSIGGMQLQNTSVTAEGLKLIANNYKQLTHLVLMSLDVGNEGIIALASLTELRVLVLRGCTRVNSTAISRLAQLPHLKELNLLNNSSLDVTDEVITDLMYLSNLEVLGIGDHHVGNVLTDCGMEVLASLNNLKSLSLAFFHWQFAGAGLGPLVNLTQLESLDLQGSNNVNDSTLSVIAMISTITSLQLSRCGKISSCGMKYVKKLKNLQSLSLASCHRITDEGLSQLENLTSLTQLVLSGLSEISDHGLFALGKCKSLKTLDLSQCDFLTGKGLKSFSDTPLSSLTLSGCSEVSDEGLMAVGRITSLTKLDMCQCVHVTDKGVASLRRLTALTGLDMAYCPLVADASLHVLSKLPHLTTFKLNGCGQITDYGIAQITCLTGLLTAHLDRCHNLTDRGMQALAKCTRLTSLRLQRCPQITDMGVSYLSALSRLSILNLSLCPHVTETGLQSLRPLSSLACLEY